MHHILLTRCIWYCSVRSCRVNEVRVPKGTKNEELRTLKRPLDQSAYKTNIPDLAQTKSQ